ncbi:MAG: hypothetical protein LBS18_02950 [Clostridiales bacterium]|jgi:hypothetical protein|nr:hypothetical protein [Clostridiales bacterium]
MTNQSKYGRTCTHMGWSREEDSLLLDAVRAARKDGAPLKAAFDRTAKETGRKPNSIRNYYYTRVKQSGEPDALLPHNPAFVPFQDTEIRALLKTVLGAQARGMSVRACTLNMGDGDNRAMLRYQNKYRSLLKSSPQTVKSVVEEMRKSGEPTIDPYEKAGAVCRAKRPSKLAAGNLLEAVADAVNRLDSVERLNVSAFFESLGALAAAASKGAKAQQQLEAMAEYKDMLLLLEDNQEQKAQISAQHKELIAQRERFNTLLRYFRQLIDVNREFLGMTSVAKVSSLSSYIRELSRNLEDCEKCVTTC